MTVTRFSIKNGKVSHEIIISVCIILGCALLGLAVWCDMREHRIPNWLVLSLLLIGFVYQILVNGPVGLLYALGGLAVGIGLFIGFYIGHGMGAGDVKLMGAAGALLGPVGALLAGACSLIAGFILVVGGMKVVPLVRRYDALRAIPEFFVQKNDAIRVPYAPAIAAGCCVAMWQLGTFSTLAMVTR
jgi:prepilin peptidase CpaA